MIKKILLFVLISSICMANARVMPTKVLLDDKTRSFRVSIKHRGDTPKWYTIKNVFYRMAEDGSMSKVKVPKEEERYTGRLIRFSPKRVFLQPNQEQVIRISAKKKAGMKDGEYRSHLYIVEDELQPNENSKDSSDLKMALYSRVAVAIPVLYRKGAVESKIDISNISLNNKGDKTKIEFDLKNEGDTFVFGRLEAYNEVDDKQVPVLEINGVSSYINTRKISYPLNLAEQKLEKAKITVIFKEDELRGGSEIFRESIEIN